jgi:hypothetical protein
MASPTAVLATVAPNLPVATQEYDATYTNQILNVQRIYYAQNDNVNQQLVNNGSSQMTMTWLGGF